MSVYEFGPFHLDAERLLLVENGKPMQLGPKVVETLLAMVERDGEIVSKQALLDRIWPEGYVDEANLAQNVYVLRKALRASIRDKVGLILAAATGLPATQAARMAPMVLQAMKAAPVLLREGLDPEAVVAEARRMIACYVAGSMQPACTAAGR